MNDSILKIAEQLNNQSVCITLSHKLFGVHTINCDKFKLINDEQRVGFEYLQHEIYILKSKLKSEIVNHGIRFSDELFTIEIITD